MKMVKSVKLAVGRDRLRWRNKGNGYIGEGYEEEKDIWIRAKDILEAYKKALHYRKKGDVKKVLEVISVELQGIVDKK